MRCYAVPLLVTFLVTFSLVYIGRAAAASKPAVPLKAPIVAVKTNCGVPGCNGGWIDQGGPALLPCPVCNPPRGGATPKAPKPAPPKPPKA
jgi:hypothetical protein